MSEWSRRETRVEEEKVSKIERQSDRTAIESKMKVAELADRLRQEGHSDGAKKLLNAMQEAGDNIDRAMKGEIILSKESQEAINEARMMAAEDEKWLANSKSERDRERKYSEERTKLQVAYVMAIKRNDVETANRIKEQIKEMDAKRATQKELVRKEQSEIDIAWIIKNEAYEIKNEAKFGQPLKSEPLTQPIIQSDEKPQSTATPSLPIIDVTPIAIAIEQISDDLKKDDSPDPVAEHTAQIQLERQKLLEQKEGILKQLHHWGKIKTPEDFVLIGTSIAKGHVKELNTITNQLDQLEQISKDVEEFSYAISYRNYQWDESPYTIQNRLQSENNRICEIIDQYQKIDINGILTRGDTPLHKLLKKLRELSQWNSKHSRNPELQKLVIDIQQRDEEIKKEIESFKPTIRNFENALNRLKNNIINELHQVNLAIPQWSINKNNPFPYTIPNLKLEEINSTHDAASEIIRFIFNLRSKNITEEYQLLSKLEQTMIDASKNQNDDTQSTIIHWFHWQSSIKNVAEIKEIGQKITQEGIVELTAAKQYILKLRRAVHDIERTIDTISRLQHRGTIEGAIKVIDAMHHACLALLEEYKKLEHKDCILVELRNKIVKFTSATQSLSKYPELTNLLTEANKKLDDLEKKVHEIDEELRQFNLMIWSLSDEMKSDVENLQNYVRERDFAYKMHEHRIQTSKELFRASNIPYNPPIPEFHFRDSPPTYHQLAIEEARDKISDRFKKLYDIIDTLENKDLIDEYQKIIYIQQQLSTLQQTESKIVDSKIQEEAHKVLGELEKIDTTQSLSWHPLKVVEPLKKLQEIAKKYTDQTSEQQTAILLLNLWVKSLDDLNAREELRKHTNQEGRDLIKILFGAEETIERLKKKYPEKIIIEKILNILKRNGKKESIDYRDGSDRTAVGERTYVVFNNLTISQNEYYSNNSYDHGTEIYVTYNSKTVFNNKQGKSTLEYGLWLIEFNKIVEERL